MIVPLTLLDLFPHVHFFASNRSLYILGLLTDSSVRIMLLDTWFQTESHLANAPDENLRIIRSVEE